MTTEAIERAFRERVSAKIHLVAEGTDRFRVSTPFLFEDGDHLVIVLKKEGARWVLSDEAHTYMHLTYDIDEKDLHKGTRQRIISSALATHRVEDRSGELILGVLEERFGDALFSFVQALLNISYVSYLSRDRAQSTFMEDFRSLLCEVTPQERRTFNWTDPEHDPKGMYRVDCRINGLDQQVFVHALASNEKTRDTTIALHQFQKWKISFRSVAIFEDQKRINRRVLARFRNVSRNVSEKQFSNLPENRSEITQYLRESISG